MNKRMGILFFPLAIIAGSSFLEGGFNSKINKGNRYYEKGRYGEAMKKYTDAEIDRPGLPVTRYNRGNAYYRQGDFEKAAVELSGSLSLKDAAQKKQAHYNLGNTFFRMNDFGRAADQFKQALKIDPSDQDAKYNLETTLKRIREQKQGGSPKKDQKEQNEKKQNKEQKNKDKTDKNKEKNKDKKKETRTDEQRENTSGSRMSREDAQRILDALRDEENKTQKKVRPKYGSGSFIEKDW